MQHQLTHQGWRWWHGRRSCKSTAPGWCGLRIGVAGWRQAGFGEVTDRRKPPQCPRYCNKLLRPTTPARNQGTQMHDCAQGWVTKRARTPRYRLVNCVSWQVPSVANAI